MSDAEESVQVYRYPLVLAIDCGASAGGCSTRHNRSMTFHLNSPEGAGKTFGTGAVTRFGGEEGLGFFRLGMVVDFVVQPAGVPSDAALLTAGGRAGSYETPTIVELAAEVRLGSRLIGSFAPLSAHLPIRSYPAQANQQTLPLACDLDRGRLEAIENARAGGSLALDINFHGRFSGGSTFNAGEQFTVNQGVWIDVLAAMGYRNILLVEVPLPDVHDQPELAKAVGDLKQAMFHMNQGHDRDAVGSLRDALEQVSLAFGDDDKVPADLQRILFADSRAMTKGDRLRVLRRALKLVTHPARHRDEVTAAIDWSRIDSSQLIFMTAAFINEMSAPDARPSQAPATGGTAETREIQ